MYEMICKNCLYLRTDITIRNQNTLVTKMYGQFTHPCNRYPINAMRHPNEPACGEFEKEGNHNG